VAGGPAVQPIVTPEAVVLDVERAGVASRAIAFLLDVLALGLIIFVLVLVIVQGIGSGDGSVAMSLLAVVTSLGTVIAWFCGFETFMRGRTPGKAAMGLRVVSADGTTERFQQAFLRAAVGLVDFFLVPVGFVAVVAALLSPRDQRIGDMAAGTIVVRERTAGTVAAAAWFRPPHGWEQYARSLDVTALDDDVYGLIRRFLLRSIELTPGARDHLAVRIANPVAVRIAHEPPPNVHPHAFLECVAAKWQLLHVPNPYTQPAVADGQPAGAYGQPGGYGQPSGGPAAPPGAYGQPTPRIGEPTGHGPPPPPPPPPPGD
jgi:uncharacterized RDD family membrane protein YckC